jgi:cytochrome c oxidase assembly protein subunit 15
MVETNQRFSLTVERYKQLTYIACFFIAAIIVTGASVRVTGSGLGCPTWPKCSSDSFTPKEMETGHALIEFGNRVFTGLLSLSVIAAVAGSIFRRPRSKTLIWLSLGLVLGVLAQIVLGGITVLLKLHPLSVGAHMLLSCIILSCAVILAVVSKRKSVPSLRNLFKASRHSLIMILTYIVVILGIVVTAAGPHAGDQRTTRLDVSVESVARIHSISAWTLLICVVILLLYFRDRSRSLIFLAGIIVVQGAWGYAQYAMGVPSWMVLGHVLLATVLFVAASNYWILSVMSREAQKI